jgi:hypothetical protein
MNVRGWSEGGFSLGSGQGLKFYLHLADEFGRRRESFLDPRPHRPLGRNISLVLGAYCRVSKTTSWPTA